MPGTQRKVAVAHPTTDTSPERRPGFYQGVVLGRCSGTKNQESLVRVLVVFDQWAGCFTILLVAWWNLVGFGQPLVRFPGEAGHGDLPGGQEPDGQPEW